MLRTVFSLSIAMTVINRAIFWTLKKVTLSELLLNVLLKFVVKIKSWFLSKITIDRELVCHQEMELMSRVTL